VQPARAPVALMPPGATACACPPLPKRALWLPCRDVSPRFERPLVWISTGAHFACTRGPQRVPAPLDQVYAFAQLASGGAAGIARHALAPLPAKHDSALRAKANEGAGWCVREDDLISALDCVRDGEGEGVRVRVGCTLSISLRDNRCSSTGGRLCAERTRSALAAQ
jgi:hypothetical protein